MKNADRAAVVAAEWIAKAENDLLNATHTLTLAAARRIRRAVRAVLPRSLLRVPARKLPALTDEIFRDDIEQLRR